MSDFYNRLDLLRKERGEAITDIASFLGISGPAIHGWKKGGLPKPDKLRLLADHYGTTVEWLLGGIGTSPPQSAAVERGNAEVELLRSENTDLRERLSACERKNDELLTIIKNLTTPQNGNGVGRAIIAVAPPARVGGTKRPA